MASRGRSIQKRQARSAVSFATFVDFPGLLFIIMLVTNNDLSRGFLAIGSNWTPNVRSQRRIPSLKNSCPNGHH